jgi:hypothetical protein
MQVDDFAGVRVHFRFDVVGIQPGGITLSLKLLHSPVEGFGIPFPHNHCFAQVRSHGSPVDKFGASLMHAIVHRTAAGPVSERPLPEFVSAQCLAVSSVWLDCFGDPRHYAQ